MQRSLTFKDRSGEKRTVFSDADGTFQIDEIRFSYIPQGSGKNDIRLYPTLLINNVRLSPGDTDVHSFLAPGVDIQQAACTLTTERGDALSLLSYQNARSAPPFSVTQRIRGHYAPVARL